MSLVTKTSSSSAPVFSEVRYSIQDSLKKAASHFRANNESEAIICLTKTNFKGELDLKRKVFWICNSNYVFTSSEKTYKDVDPKSWKCLARAEAIERLCRIAFPEHNKTRNAKIQFALLKANSFLTDEVHKNLGIKVDRNVFYATIRKYEWAFLAMDVHYFFNFLGGPSHFFSRKFPEIVSIDFSLCQISDEILDSILEKCENLRTVILSGGSWELYRNGNIHTYSESITARKFQQVQLARPKLHLQVRLDFRAVVERVDAGVAKLAEKDPTLQEKWEKIRMSFLKDSCAPTVKHELRRIVLQLIDPDLSTSTKEDILLRMVSALEINYMAMFGCYPMPYLDCASSLTRCMDFIFCCCRRPPTDDEISHYQFVRLRDIADLVTSPFFERDSKHLRAIQSS